MRVAVLGATGRTGVPLVTQAHERGHEVKALVRSRDRAARLFGGKEQPTFVEGDLLDRVAVDKVVADTDAVVNASGPSKASPNDLQRRAIGHVLEAMDTHGVRRLVTLTGAGVRVTGDEPKFVDKLFGLALRRLQPDLLADSEASVALVRASDQDWTVVRAPRLTDHAPRGGYRDAPFVGRSTGTRIARADLATFILDELDRGRYRRQAPVVTW